MSDFILKDGDAVMFIPSFGVAIVIAPPGSISGTAISTIGGKAICVEGDEDSVEAKGCTYMTPQYPIPGMGTVKIKALAGNQTGKKYVCDGKKVLLKGNQFDAVFEVQVPAMQPTPGGPVPDSTSKYDGKGMFMTTNLKHKGS